MTETITPQTSELEALERHLAVYGPDLSRWPLATQQRFVVLLTNNGEAQRLMAQAQALARIVFEGPIPAVPPEHAIALRAKLMRAVEVERGSKSVASALPALRPGVVVPALVEGRPDAKWAHRDPAQPMPALPRVFGLPASAALAASLVLGLVVGTLGLVDHIMAPMSPMASVQIDGNAGPDAAGPEAVGFDAELAFGSDVFDFDQEGTL